MTEMKGKVYLTKEDMPKHCSQCPFCNSADECILQSEDNNFLADTWDDLICACPLEEIDPNSKGVEFDQFKNAPTVDAVSRGVHDQVRWERDVAMEQLEEHGIPFGGKAPDVVKVVRCKDCKKWEYDENFSGWCVEWRRRTLGNYFCSYGERKDNG